jgi:hypothetical protein
MQGRRRTPDVHRVDLEPGDYIVKPADGGEVSQLIFCAPRTGAMGVIPNVGHGKVVGGVREPEWTIVENATGTVTVTPSIDQGNGGYHGWLTDGIWSDG